jgi:hypothetical protein
LNTRQALLGWLVCASAALGGGAAVASKVPGDIVTGTIIAINVNMVNIQGQVYSVAGGTPAYSEVQNFKPGQVVDVQLDGPAKSSASHVISIVLHPGD